MTLLYDVMSPAACRYSMQSLDFQVADPNKHRHQTVGTLSFLITIYKNQLLRTRMLLMRGILSFLTAVLLLLGCAADPIDFATMDASEKTANVQAGQELVAFMSLETMFPEREVRSLARAAAQGDVRKIADLAAQGVDVNARGAKNATPLFWALRNIQGFEKLLELGADPNVIFDDGGSVMHWAVRHESSMFLDAALDHGGDVNLIAGSMHETPIFEAIGPDTKQKLDILLRAGANFDAQRLNKDTPMMVAAALGQFDVVYKLLTVGADYEPRNMHGMTLADTIEWRMETMDPDNELSSWMRRVIVWLADRSVEIRGDRRIKQ